MGTLRHCPLIASAATAFYIAEVFKQSSKTAPCRVHNKNPNEPLKVEPKHEPPDPDSPSLQTMA